jgi:Spy/CpxP family protein refolding chaperone
MKRRLMIAIALFTSLLVLIPVSAQGPGARGRRPATGLAGPGGHGGPGEFGPQGEVPSRRFLENVLKFTDEQFTALEALLEQHRSVVEPIHEQIRDLERTLRTELEAENPAAATVGQLVIDIHDSRQELLDNREALREGFRALLTEEQLATVEELKSRPRRSRGRAPRG